MDILNPGVTQGELLANAHQRLALAQQVEETVIKYLKLLTGKQPEPEDILRYFTECAEADIVCNVNGYDRTIENFKTANKAGLIGSIVVFISTQLNFLFGETTINMLRRDAFGDRGGVSHASWVSGAVGLYAESGMKLQTCNEDFALWLTIRAAKLIIFEQAVTQPPKNPRP